MANYRISEYAKADLRRIYWRFGERMSSNLGYRYFEDDYDNLPSYAWDMTQSGPVVGYTWVF